MDIDVEESTCASFKQKCHVQDSPTHKDMYKKTPKSWKDKFRRACVQRLRKNRTKLVEQLRGAETSGSPSREEKSKEFIDELMKEELDELKSIQDGPNTLCTCCTRGFHDNTDDGSDSMFDVMDEIREELMKEEKLILEEYDDLVNFDENSIHAAIEGLGCDYVICPVCKSGIRWCNRHDKLKSPLSRFRNTSTIMDKNSNSLPMNQGVYDISLVVIVNELKVYFLDLGSSRDREIFGCLFQYCQNLEVGFWFITRSIGNKRNQSTQSYARSNARTDAPFCPLTTGSTGKCCPLLRQSNPLLVALP
eukprot:Seg446.13 transcript_id=Seg446.13/GoldUCD/mRNA.D3Y31 product="RPA-interacting protein A" protein_id=Seg446.13/GoldUCD/D3Y31